jgi:hypothetical protein
VIGRGGFLVITAWMHTVYFEQVHSVVIILQSSKKLIDNVWTMRELTRLRRKSGARGEVWTGVDIGSPQPVGGVGELTLGVSVDGEVALDLSSASPPSTPRRGKRTCRKEVPFSSGCVRIEVPGRHCWEILSRYLVSESRSPRRGWSRCCILSSPVMVFRGSG